MTVLCRNWLALTRPFAGEIECGLVLGRKQVGTETYFTGPTGYRYNLGRSRLVWDSMLMGTIRHCRHWVGKVRPFQPSTLTWNKLGPGRVRVQFLAPHMCIRGKNVSIVL